MIRLKLGTALSAVAALALLAACTTKPEAQAVIPPSSGPTTQSSGMQTTIIPGSAEDLRVNVGDTVHFEYNRSDVRDEDRGVLQRQASWLQRYPQVRVTVQGNCDERGTREYNLALGARRANAVKEYLVSLGISAARVDTISYGKERPMCTESTEECWAQNRRGVTVISSGGASS
jgi:peptidoglycan-associated lipoprotein